MKKKFLSLALVLAMALTLLPTAAFAAAVTTAHTDPTTQQSCSNPSVNKVEAVAKTCTTDGTAEHWKCDTCNGLFTSNDNGTTLTATTAEDLTIPAGHTIASDPTTAEAPATCCAAGTKALYACTGGCGKTFIDAAGKTEATNENKVIAANGAHTFASDAAPTSNNNGTHTGTCTVGNKEVTENCTDNGSGKCTVCGGDVTGGGNPDNPTAITAFTVAPDAHPPFTAGAAVSFSIDTVNGAAENTDALRLTGVTWTLKGAQVDATGTLIAAPSTPGTYDLVFTAEVAKDGFVLDKGVTSRIGDVEVLAAPETPAEKPEDTTNKAPSTNSQGIPVASEVTTPQQATQAVNTLKNTNATVLQDRLMTNDTAFSSFKALESAVISTKNIKVEVSKESSAPSDVRTGVDIDGAAFNAASSNSTVSLVVGAPSQAYPITAGYQISMSLTGVGSDASLAVPVVITLPIPSDVKPERVVVLHYHGSSTPSVIDHVVSGDSIRFTVTGFSDFVVTDQSIPTSSTGGGTGYLGGNLKNNQNDISDILPAIAAMLAGDGVFVDVPGTHWAAKEIRWARDGGLMSGYGNGNFGPTASTTRQQLWMVLARLSGTRPADMAMARQWAINTGVSDGSNPTGILSRQQLVTMLYRFAKSQGKDVSASAKLSGYTDSAKVASYAKEALSWAAAKGIISGSNGKLNPEGTATRAHFAVFLYRYSNGWS